MGIKDPVVDALTDRVIFATDRDDLVAATHALDRVLLWNIYMVPQYHRAVVWLAYWNKFGIPEKQPTYRRRRHRFLVDRPRQGKGAAAKYKGQQLNGGRDPPRIPGARRGGRRLAVCRPGGRSPPARPTRAAWAVGLRRSQIRAGLHAFRLCRTWSAPKGGTFNFGPSQLGLQPEPLDLQHAESASSPRAMRRRAWRCASIR